MWKFIKHEWEYRLTSPTIWIYLLFITAFIFASVSYDAINLGGGVGSVYKNAPFVITSLYSSLSYLMCLLLVSSFMIDTATRDFEHDMYQFVFTSPIRERDYFLGKFIGTATIAIIPLLGVSIGSLLGPLMPWADHQRYGAIVLAGHLHGLLWFVLPNIIIFGSLIYSLGTIFRSKTMPILATLLMLVFSSLSQVYLADLDTVWIANILDPFGGNAYAFVTKYLTVSEKNSGEMVVVGALLWNRLLWLTIALGGLIFTYYKFSFNSKNQKSKKAKTVEEVDFATLKESNDIKPTKANKFSLITLWHLTKVEVKAVVFNPTFAVISAIGVITLTIMLFNFSVGYGTSSYPVTYSVVDRISGGFGFIYSAIVFFYSGVLVWRAREDKFSEIQDATPISSGMLFVSKLLALTITIAILQLFSIVVGIGTQLAYGFTNIEIALYFKSLFLHNLVGYAFSIVIILLFHYILNNKNLTYVVYFAFLIVNAFVWNFVKVSSNMVKYGETSRITYSDMNGYGPFVTTTAWFTIYWTLFAIILSFIAFAFFVRGKEIGFGKRLQNAVLVLRNKRNSLIAFMLLFLLCGGYIYYNTKIVNTILSSKNVEDLQVEYEQKYKIYEGIPQPRIYKVNFDISIMPEERNMTYSIEMWAKNISGKAISEVHFTTPPGSDSMKISIDGAKVKLQDARLSYRILELAKPMQPTDSILIRISNSNLTKGFENEVTNTQITQNGTFFTNSSICPVLGYNSRYEISDKNVRTKRNLPTKKRMPLLDENNLVARANNYVSFDADWVEFSTIISTSADQIAVAPGSLVKSWSENNRAFFQYKLDTKVLNFCAFVSAKYEVERKQVNGIDFEVYYIKDHAYNVPRMMSAMEKSLDYYTKNFGPYYQKQCRILEFPRYNSYAQSFPGTMPYSEGLGFIIDLRKLGPDDIDQVFYVVAHEMAHQYWAHQVSGANMQGSEFLSESMAQYSALMVMEKEYGKESMKKFLKYELDGYFGGRAFEFEAERPLIKTEQQQYVHYKKGSLVMYYLKEMIGEQKVNEALKTLIDSFAYKQPPYPTSLTALRAFKKVTPDSLQYIFADQFENITLYANRVVDASYKKVGSEYEVTIKTTSEKFRADSLGKETAVPIHDFVDIGIFSEAQGKSVLGKSLLMKRLQLTQKENSFTFKTTTLPSKVGIDPYHYLIDRISDDNIKVLTEIK